MQSIAVSPTRRAAFSLPLIATATADQQQTSPHTLPPASFCAFSCANCYTTSLLHLLSPSLSTTGAAASVNPTTQTHRQPTDQLSAATAQHTKHDAAETAVGYQ